MAKTQAKPEGPPPIRTFQDFPKWQEANAGLQALQGKEYSLKSTLNRYGGAGEDEGALVTTIRAAERLNPNAKADLLKLRQEYSLVTQAIPEQVLLLERIESECSREISKSLLPWYRENVQKTVELLVQLAALNEESVAVFHALQMNRITRSGLPQPAFPEIGIRKDTESLVSRRSRELVEVGACPPIS